MNHRTSPDEQTVSHDEAMRISYHSHVVKNKVNDSFDAAKGRVADRANAMTEKFDAKISDPGMINHVEAVNKSKSRTHKPVRTQKVEPASHFDDDPAPTVPDTEEANRAMDRASARGFAKQIGGVMFQDVVKVPRAVDSDAPLMLQPNKALLPADKSDGQFIAEGMLNTELRDVFAGFAGEYAVAESLTIDDQSTGAHPVDVRRGDPTNPVDVRPTLQPVG